MASSNQPVGVFDNIQSKLCSRCTTRKTLGEFIRFHGSREKEFAICNNCSEKKKGKRPLRPNEDSEAQPEYTLDENSDLEEEINNEDEVIYEFAELEEIVARYFTNIEENTEVNFSKTFELEDELIDNFNTDYDTTEEDKFRNIIYFFLLPIEAELDFAIIGRLENFIVVKIILDKQHYILVALKEWIENLYVQTIDQRRE